MHLRYSFLTAASLAALLPAGPAAATGGTLEFGGLVSRTCVINLGIPGILDTNAAGTMLSSKAGAGRPATAVIVSTGADFKVSLSTPTGFTAAPPGFGGNVDFETNYTMTGATSVLNVRSGTQTLLNIGSTSLAVDLTATRTSGFPAGPYLAQTTLTCE